MSATVTVAIVAYGASPTLPDCVAAALASEGVELRLVIVDNGCDAAILAAIEALDDPRVELVGPPENRGFAGGCNRGLVGARSEFVMLLNPDAYVRPDAIAALVDVAARPEVGIASASLRLAHAPDLLNSAGNPVHYSGMTWSGAFNEPAVDHATEVDVASATGAACVLRTETWQSLGGFDEQAFAYLEDTELSLRCWLAGLAVRYVPEAVVLHDYEFSRHARKHYLLERNRLLMLLTVFSARTLVVLAPALLAFELVMLLQSLVARSLGAKLRSYGWLLRHVRDVAARRRLVQSGRRRHDRDLVPFLRGRIEPANIAVPPGMGLLNAILDGYWRVARRLI